MESKQENTDKIFFEQMRVEMRDRFQKNQKEVKEETDKKRN